MATYELRKPEEVHSLIVKQTLREFFKLLSTALQNADTTQYHYISAAKLGITLEFPLTPTTNTTILHSHREQIDIFCKDYGWKIVQFTTADITILIKLVGVLDSMLT